MSLYLWTLKRLETNAKCQKQMALFSYCIIFFLCKVMPLNLFWYLSTTKTVLFIHQSKSNCCLQFSQSESHHPATCGPAAHFTVHIPLSSLEFWSAVFYSASSDLCPKMEEGELWFLCNFNRFNALQSLHLFVSFCSWKNVTCTCVFLGR